MIILIFFSTWQNLKSLQDECLGMFVKKFLGYVSWGRRPTLCDWCHSMCWGPGLKKKQKERWESASILFSFQLQLHYDRVLQVLMLWLPHLDRFYPRIVSQNKAFLASADFVRYYVMVIKRVTEYDSHQGQLIAKDKLALGTKLNSSVST